MSQPPNFNVFQDWQHQASHTLGFASIFDKYQRLIYNYLLRMTQNETGDLTQEAFIWVHRSLPAFPGEASLSTWISHGTFRVNTRNSCHAAQAH
jgi:DNA-directed RNA polymerase specialized sigma24 family protein